MMIFIFIFGLAIGSFLNCLMWRLHKEESIAGRSYCPSCHQQIAWYDNIPVLSFIILRGRCRHCQEKISWQYPLVELSAGLLFVLVAANNFRFSIFDFRLIDEFPIFDATLILALLRDWFLVSVLLLIFVYDLKYMLILDVVSLPAIVIVATANLLLGNDWQNMVISGIIGAGFFFLQYVVSRGKWIGGGDIRLGALMGVALGYPSILPAILLSYIIGSFVSIGLILSKKRQWGSEIPLGVFLVIGTLLVYLWPDQISQLYDHLFIIY